MSGAVIGSETCSRCGGTMRYTEGKTGGISGSCNGCGRQTFDRSPKACEGLKRRLAGASSSSNGSAGEPTDKGEAFDYSKL